MSRKPRIEPIEPIEPVAPIQAIQADASIRLNEPEWLFLRKLNSFPSLTRKAFPIYFTDGGAGRKMTPWGMFITAAKEKGLVDESCTLTPLGRVSVAAFHKSKDTQ